VDVGALNGLLSLHEGVASWAIHVMGVRKVLISGEDVVESVLDVVF
jgi:hypothetical protein